MDGSSRDERELAPDEGPSGAGRRLLLVGRDPEARSALTAILEPRGYAVTEAEADQGLGAALEGAQIVVVEVGDGQGADEDLDHVRALVPTTSSIQVLVVHSERLPAGVVRSFQRGADDFMVRPFENFELVLRLEVLWRVKELRDQARTRSEQVEALATTDELTVLLNRREFERQLELELRRVKRFGVPVACVCLDCDQFSSVVASHGRAMGRQVVREVARILVATLRDTDLVCRSGDHAFTLALPGADLVTGAQTAERVRQLVGMSVVRLGDAESELTVSIGLAASTPVARLGLRELAGRAEAALEAARRGGGDQVCHGVVRTEEDEA